MRFKPDTVRRLSVAAILLLAVLAAVLSVAALMPRTPDAATPALPPSASPTTTQAAPATSSATESASTQPTTTEPTQSSASASPSPDATSPSVAGGEQVLLVGDSNSLGDAGASWVETVAQSQGWGEVQNISAPGRGYLAQPRDCESVEPCANFEGSVDLIAGLDPSVVITFGGTADGDIAIGDAARAYFEALREALPDAELIAISPTTTEDEWPYYLTMHERSIRAAVEAVGGTMIDIGRIGLGEGTLSEQSQAEIAQIVIDELS